MNLSLICLTLGFAVLFSYAAAVMAPPAIPTKVAVSEHVVVGKITEIAAQTENFELNPRDTRPAHRATLAVEEVIFGPKSKSLQFLFPAIPTSSGRVQPLKRPTPIELKVGDEALLYLLAHPTKKDLLVVMSAQDVCKKSTTTNFPAEKQLATEMAALLTDQAAGLRSKRAEDRYLTAAMSLIRHRHRWPGATTTEALSAEESKSLLNELAEVDWSIRLPREKAVPPSSVFLILGLTEDDGWRPPQDYANLEAVAKRWIKDHAGSFRLQRFVRQAPAKSSDKAGEK